MPTTYELSRANGAALPALLAADSGCVTQLIGGMLYFNPRDYRATYDIQRTCGLGETRKMPDPGVVGSYRVRGDSVSFLDPRGQPTGGGRLGGDTIVITGPRHVLTFKRLPPPDSI